MEAKTYEIAMYQTDYDSIHPWDVKGAPKDWTRISESLTVEFTPLSKDEIVQGKLASLKRRENKLRDDFSRSLNVIETQRANLLALNNDK